MKEDRIYKILRICRITISSRTGLSPFFEGGSCILTSFIRKTFGNRSNKICRISGLRLRYVSNAR